MFGATVRNREHLALVKTGPEPCRVADPDGKPQQLPSPTATVAAPRPLGASGPEPFFCTDPFGLWIESILEDK